MPELNTKVFLVPAFIVRNGKRQRLVKNGEDRLVVLNNIAKSVIEDQWGRHPEFVFTFSGHSLTGMNNSAWQTARKKVGLEQVHVHDLKHTFGRRLRAVGVDFEDRQDLLGHRSGRITTHYSAAELQSLLHAASKVCDVGSDGPTLTMLRLNKRKSASH